MKTTHVAYRTPSYGYTQHAVVPTQWYDNLVQWICNSECGHVIGLTHGDGETLRIPVSWPSYGKCNEYSKTVTLLEWS